jgi:DNA-binding transcriptional LysR family regulator
VDSPLSRRPIRPVEVSELRAFCLAVELGSLGRAARALGVSQPAMSRRLRSLEALAGARLLERSTRGVRPTTAGTELYVAAGRLLRQADAVDDVLAGLGGATAPVRLAASHTAAEFLLPERLVSFERRDHPPAVELVISNSTLVREQVRDGRAELGMAAVDVGTAPPDMLRVIPYADDEVVVGVPAGHPWARCDEIELDAFLATSMVLRDPGAHSRRTVEQALAARGLRAAAPVAEVGSTGAARAAALEAGVPFLLSALAISGHDDVVARRVRGLPFRRRIAVLLQDESRLRPAARILLGHLLAGGTHNPG